MKIVEKIGNEVKINIFPKQHDFIATEVDDAFFGGSVGGGKSIALLLFALKRRMEFPKSHGLLLRRTFRQLENSLILESRKIYPFFGAVYNEQKKRWTFPNGSIQSFNFCDTDADSYNFHSDNYDDICFDEASHFSEFQVTYISTRCRTAIPNCKALIRAASNPGNVGHLWCKKRYIDPARISPIWTDPVTKKTMTFIPSRVTDNPALMENDPGYMDRLRELPEKKYRALAEGDWSVSEGQFFEEWNEKQHVLRLRRVPDTYTMKFLSLDWGFADPACVLWWEVTPSGRVFIYRELYLAHLHPKELGQKILEMSPENERYEYMCASPDIWGKKSDMKDGGEPIAEGIQAGLGGRVNMIKAMNARVEGWLKMKEWLSKAPDGKPWLQISPNCENLIRTIPGAIYETRPGRNNEDMDERTEDHACLIGSTKVLTRDGEVDICSLVGTAGEIWTVAGWKKFSDCRRTRKNAEVVELVFSDGTSVVATPDHRVLTNQGWKQIQELVSSDLIVRTEWKIPSSYQKKDNSLLEKIIIFVDSIFKKKEFAFIAPSGPTTTVPFQMDFMSIIRTGTASTIKLKTWNYLTDLFTLPSICQPRKEKNWQESILKKYARLPQLGTEIQKIMRRMLPLVKNHGQRLNPGSRLIDLVGCVVMFLRPMFRIGQNIAALIVKCVSTGETTQKLGNISWIMIRNAGRQDVYNLEVEDVHSFSVNGGITSHNCESARYGAVSLMNIPKGSMNHPNSNLYDTLFGERGSNNSNVSHLPKTGKSGY